ncbi:MAG: HAD family hydrolase [Candidatus Heimdallarchaeota archaeon]|nr:MAG: HAD family hydrolase [Candidatus Heimdallarchaeota archaeon]
MKSFDVISLDLFNTLVYIDRGSFDLWSHMEKALLQFPELQQKVPQISLNDIITDYYSVVRQQIRNSESEKEFRNDDILFGVLERYVKPSPDLTSLASKIITYYFESALPLIHPFPGLHDTLTYLKEKEYTLVLASNHSWAQNGWDVLHRYNLVEFFDRIIFSGDIGWRKPSPKVFSAAVSGLPYRSKDYIIHIGDEVEADIKGALNFGIKALWIRSPRYESKNEISGVQEIISDISELPQIL